MFVFKSMLLCHTVVEKNVTYPHQHTSVTLARIDTKCTIFDFTLIDSQAVSFFFISILTGTILAQTSLISHVQDTLKKQDRIIQRKKGLKNFIFLSQFKY